MENYKSYKSQRRKTIVAIAAVAGGLTLFSFGAHKLMKNRADYSAEHERLEQMIQNAPRIGVCVGCPSYDAEGKEIRQPYFDTLIKQELKDAGIKTDILGEEAMTLVRNKIVADNHGRKPWAQNGIYTLPDLKPDGTFGGAKANYQPVGK